MLLRDVKLFNNTETSTTNYVFQPSFLFKSLVFCYDLFKFLGNMITNQAKCTQTIASLPTDAVRLFKSLSSRDCCTVCNCGPVSHMFSY